MRFSISMSFAVLIAIQAAGAESEIADPGGIESLGRELLDDLTPEILRRQEMPAQNPHAPNPRFGDLGEDIGGSSGPLSLARVRQRMREAESLLAGQQTVSGDDTLQQAASTQQEVVKQLDQLIAELSKQCQGGQCQPSDQPPKPSQRSQSKPGKTGRSAGRGQTAARDSNARLDQTSSQPADKPDRETLAKELWGHLPERSREQMLQSFSGEFLPKYELEIEQYYRRLSEDADANRRR
jgi:hypothetical protein